MTKSAADRAEVRFKQLCCLGLGGEAVMPALLGELRTMIPSFGGNFFFADENGALINVCDDNPESPKLARLYLEKFHDRPTTGGVSFTQAMHNDLGVNGLEEALIVDVDTFRRNDFYNLIFRPLGYDEFLRLTVREPGRRLGLGSMTVFRSPGEAPFTAADRRRLAALEPFVAHALTDHGTGGVPLVDSGKNGLIVANGEGAPIYFSREGRRLLFLATHPRYVPDAAERGSAVLPPALAQICRDLVLVFEDKAPAAAPAYQCQNVWGGFSFRAQWLEGATPQSGLIGITVSHQEPLPIKLLRRASELPLSPRQAEISALMAQGHSLDEIAGRLGLSKHTAVAHGRTIYEKLGVHNRSELLGALLADQAPPEFMH